MTRRTAGAKPELIEVEGVRVELTRKRVRNVNLRVRADGTIAVSAPARVPLAEIARFVSSRRDWIENARKRQSQKTEADAVRCDEGSPVMLWGARLVCHLAEAPAGSPGSACSFAVDGDRLCITAGTLLSGDDEPARTLRERALEQWLATQVRAATLALLPSLEELVGVRCSVLRFRRMKSRWGSCNVRTATVTINTALAHHPRECLRYVIIHELCHLHEPNHGARFHALMDGFCPEWRTLRASLNGR